MRAMRCGPLLLAAVLAGCGGGAPHVVKSALPGTIRTASVAFRIGPTKVPAGATRRPKYVSYGTQSAKVSVSSAGLPTTTTVIRCSYGACSANIDAPVATDTFAVTLYDDWTAQGTVLSAGSTTQTIVESQANNVNITFDGVPAKIALALGVTNPLIGAPFTTQVYVNAIDAAGYTIVGPGTYNPAIELSLSDPSGSTSLSKTTVTSADDVVTLAYNGTARITATVSGGLHGGALDQTATFEPANVSAEFAIPNVDAAPADIVKGSDGALWFAEGAGKMIGRIDVLGIVSEYATTGVPSSIVAAPDGTLWFTELAGDKQYGRIATDGTVTEYALPVAPGTPSAPVGMAFGVDGNLYVADAASGAGVYAVTPLTGALVKAFGNLGTGPTAIVSGPDGNIWVGTPAGVTRIVPIDGTVSSFSTSGAVSSLAAGTDGGVWFADSAGKAGNVTPAGSVTEYALPHYGGATYKIVAASDATYWLTYGHGGHGGDGRSCRIGHVTAAGAVSSYAIADCDTASLAFGPDGNLWLAESTRRKIGVFPVAALR